uniref:Uncharacterized protein n=1 Tax=Anguilla anguilla TaxID=7936 RepID=A0A0E9TS10_ANGAN
MDSIYIPQFSSKCTKHFTMNASHSLIHTRTHTHSLTRQMAIMAALQGTSQLVGNSELMSSPSC